MAEENVTVEDVALQEAVRVLRLIAEQGGDIVEPWSTEMARLALSTILPIGK
jgi:hypothetical protein